jgi:hypothetical protein
LLRDAFSIIRKYWIGRVYGDRRRITSKVSYCPAAFQSMVALLNDPPIILDQSG